MANKTSDGNVIVIPAFADTAFREVVPFGTHSIGVAQTAGLIGEDISVEIIGVYSIPATEAEAFVVGSIAKFSTSTKLALLAGTVTMGMVVVGKEAGVIGDIEVKIG